MRVKRLIVGAAVSSLAVVSAIALIANGATEKPKKAAIATPTCASIHFGMSDATLEGYWTSAYGTNIPYSGDGKEKASLISSLASGITVTSFQAASTSTTNGKLLVAGGTYTISKKEYTAEHTHGLKLGASSGKHTDLTFAFGSNIVACDIYAAAWNEEGVSIAANGEDAINLTKDEDLTGSPNPDVSTIKYVKCHFDFESTNTLSIVTTKRLVIGDIALRLA